MTNVTIKARFLKNQIHFRFKKKLFMKHVRETAKKNSSSIIGISTNFTPTASLSRY